MELLGLDADVQLGSPMTMLLLDSATDALNGLCFTRLDGVPIGCAVEGLAAVLSILEPATK